MSSVGGERYPSQSLVTPYRKNYSGLAHRMKTHEVSVWCVTLYRSVSEKNTPGGCRFESRIY